MCGEVLSLLMNHGVHGLMTILSRHYPLMVSTNGKKKKKNTLTAPFLSRIQGSGFPSKNQSSSRAFSGTNAHFTLGDVLSSDRIVQELQEDRSMNRKDVTTKFATAYNPVVVSVLCHDNVSISKPKLGASLDDARYSLCGRVGYG